MDPLAKPATVGDVVFSNVEVVRGSSKLFGSLGYLKCPEACPCRNVRFDSVHVGDSLHIDPLECLGDGAATADRALAGDTDPSLICMASFDDLARRDAVLGQHQVNQGLIGLFFVLLKLTLFICKTPGAPSKHKRHVSVARLGDLSESEDSLDDDDSLPPPQPGGLSFHDDGAEVILFSAASPSPPPTRASRNHTPAQQNDIASAMSSAMASPGHASAQRPPALQTKKSSRRATLFE